MLRLDTLRFAKRLTEAGLTPAAAEAIVEGLREADISELATKSDFQELRAEVNGQIQELRVEIKGDIQAVRSELQSTQGALRTSIAGVQAEIAGLRADIYGRLWAMGLGIVGLTVALLKILPG